MFTSTKASQMNTINDDVVHSGLTVIPNDFFAEVIDAANSLTQEIRYYIIAMT